MINLCHFKKKKAVKIFGINRVHDNVNNFVKYRKFSNKLFYN